MCATQYQNLLAILTFLLFNKGGGIGWSKLYALLKNKNTVANSNKGGATTCASGSVCTSLNDCEAPMLYTFSESD